MNEELSGILQDIKNIHSSIVEHYCDWDDCKSEIISGLQSDWTRVEIEVAMEQYENLVWNIDCATDEGDTAHVQHYIDIEHEVSNSELKIYSEKEHGRKYRQYSFDFCHEYNRKVLSGETYEKLIPLEERL